MRRGRKFKEIMIIVLILVLVLVTGVAARKVVNKFTKPQEVVTQEIVKYQEVSTKEYEEAVKSQEKIIKEQTEAIEKISNELTKYKEKEKEEEVKRQKILALQQPEIIQKELTRVGELISFTGRINYDDIVVKKKFLGKSELNLHIEYKYGFGVNLDRIKIDSFVEDTVILEIPKSEVTLKYIEIDTENSNITEMKKFFGDTFTSDEVEDILFNAQDATKNNLMASMELKDMAIQGVKDSLEKIVLKLGYKNVVFDEV